MKRIIKNVLMLILLLTLVGTSIFTVLSMRNQTASMQNMEMPNGGMDVQMGDSVNLETVPEMPTGEGGDVSAAPELPTGEGTNITEVQTNEVPGETSSSLLYHFLLAVQGALIAMLIMYLFMSGFNKRSFKETFINGDKIVIYLLSIVIISYIIYIAGNFAANGFLNNMSMDSNMNKDMNMDMSMGGTMGMGMNADITYSGAEEITSDANITSGEYDSTEIDENAILVNGNLSASIENIVVTKTGDSDGGDNTSFYGINSAIIAKAGAILNLSNVTITTDAVGANGVFSYGGSATTNNTSSDGTTVNISDSKIATSKDNSGGIMTTGGGILNAYNLTINTSGVSSAAIRSDRGGGTVNVDGGTYTTTGSGSPAVYSTAEITVKNATLTSKTAEGLVIEGANSITINNCHVTSNNTVLNGLSTTYKNVFLYQSMSGDADSGTATFTANDSIITTEHGDSFYITNTVATINLKNNTIINNDNEGNFLRAQADSWGNSGSNGGTVTLNMLNQKAIGNIVIDAVSTLNMSLTEKSYFEGIINGDNAAKELVLSLDETSSVKLTGDCYITKLNNTVSDNSNIDFNGYKLYVNGKAIN